MYFAIARDQLANLPDTRLLNYLPDTSEPIEEKFSLADELITVKRKRTLPERKAMCLNSWLKLDEFNEKKE